MNDKELLKLLEENDKYVEESKIKSIETKEAIINFKKRLEEIDRQLDRLL
jgi:hypothetical protein